MLLTTLLASMERSATSITSESSLTATMVFHMYVKAGFMRISSGPLEDERESIGSFNSDRKASHLYSMTKDSKDILPASFFVNFFMLAAQNMHPLKISRVIWNSTLGKLFDTFYVQQLLLKKSEIKYLLISLAVFT